jgi:uncharacterized protein GlcG (DUF336 family)
MIFKTPLAPKAESARHVGMPGVGASNAWRNIVSARFLRLAGTCAAVLALAACSSGGDGSGGDVCDGNCANATTFLTVDDVKQVMAQAIAEAQARGVNATIAVTDRVGNVLGVYRMGDRATRKMTIATELDANGNPVVFTGLEGISLPGSAPPFDALNLDQLGAIAKAVTGSFLSSEGNAFSTRSANFIVQENFPLRSRNQAGGPLFGVQFSQLRCSDTIMRPVNGGADPAPGIQSSPLGLSADPGGFPLYKAGTPVGGVGVIADGLYSIDKSADDVDKNLDEMIAWAATFGFVAPDAVRSEQSALVGGQQLRFSDAGDRDLMANPSQAPAFDSISNTVGQLIPVTGYTPASIKRGTAFGQPESGVRPDVEGFYPGMDAFVLVDANNTNRFPPRAGLDAAVLNGVLPLQPEEVRVIIGEAVGVANQARAGIRRFQPRNQAVRVNISMVDSLGNIIGHAKTDDPPLFGSEVSLQKARAAALMSSPTAAQYLSSLPPTEYLATSPTVNFDRTVNLADYVATYRAFVNNPNALQGETAFTNRAFGNLARPGFPDGINSSGIAGPFSKPLGQWSVFSSGVQLDLVNNGILQHVLFAAGFPSPDVGVGCAGVSLTNLLAGMEPQTQPGVFRVGGGIQIFAGSSPIYRTGPNGEDVLIGAIGISGDGIDQDDMVGFLGLDRGSRILAATSANPARHASPQIRADALTPAGSVLSASPMRYVQCPANPFLNSKEMMVCEGK